MMLFVNSYVMIYILIFTDVSDFASVTMMVTFLPGESTHSLSVSIVDDSNIEDTEMFSAILTGVSNVVIGNDDTATITILDDDRKSIIMVALYLCGRIIVMTEIL